MIYFVYEQGTGGVDPQAGYEHVGMYKGTKTIWLVKTEKTIEEVNALTVTKKVIGVDPDEEVTAMFPDLIKHKMALIRKEGSRRLTLLNDQAGGYLKEERETWYVQKAEADKYLAWDGTGDAPATPMLSALVANRPDLSTVADIANKVKENTTLLEAASGQILGIQQGLLVGVYVATDLSTALNTEWPD